jgi:hypothetical protein
MSVNRKHSFIYSNINRFAPGVCGDIARDSPADLGSLILKIS